jgi:hypothetical protein
MLTGNEAALLTASGTGDYYLLNAGIRGLPRSWERVSQIGNLLRYSPAGLSAYDRKTAGDYLALLAHADYSQVLSDIDTALGFLGDEGFFYLTAGRMSCFPPLPPTVPRWTGSLPRRRRPFP